MPTILYRVTTMPEYEGWDAPQAPGTFRFEFKSVVECYRNILKSELPFVHMHSRRNGVYRVYLELVEALAWLERKWLGYYQKETEEAVPWPDHFGSPRLSCGSLLLAKDFVSVLCPLCEASYSADQIQVLEFQAGGSIVRSWWPRPALSERAWALRDH